MTKKVLISIHPKWCEKIFSGEKTIEVRKSAPKLKPPFEVLVYMTKPKKRLIEIIKDGDYIYGDIYHGKMLFIKMDRPVYDKNWNDVAGKVIGSFVCRGIMRPNDNLQTMAKQSLLTEAELYEYSNGKPLYGWRITEPKLFDKPRELSGFGKYKTEWVALYGRDDIVFHPLKRPPQSWCLVEENDIYE